MKECPHCKSKTYYIKSSFSGSGDYYSNFDGSSADNASYHDGIFYKYGKDTYCADCNKRLIKVEDLEKESAE